MIGARPDPAGLRVTVMGLGLHGGGLASALYFARRGATVTVTDMKSEQALASSLELLAGEPVRLVLGRHESADFRETDLVIKNPGVRLSSPFLQEAIASGVPVETDISVFLRAVTNPVVAVSGTKGKSTVASAIHHGLRRRDAQARLGGNITVSPLTFITPPASLAPSSPVVLELSSWQLGDLRGKGLLDPRVSVLTVIFPDHMDAYAGDMDAYVRDKRVLIEGQSPEHTAVLNLDDPIQSGFAAHTAARRLTFSRASREADAWLQGGHGMLRTDRGPVAILDGTERLRGEHNRLNLLTAGLALGAFGMAPGDIVSSLASFPGLEHRLELFLEQDGLAFYNDSAATVPEATLQAVRSLQGSILLICGGSDKGLDFAPFRELAPLPRRVFVLEGSASAKVTAALRQGGAEPRGPFASLEAAVRAALDEARAGSSILFSPGCTSFGMFQNEFDRGRRFRQTARELVAALRGDPAGRAPGGGLS